MGEFIPTAGFANCPKCGGWQVLDATIRKKNGWPIGPVVMKDCDNCEGRGEIRLPTQPKPITIRNNSGMVEKVIEPPPVSVPTVWDGPATPSGGWSAPLKPVIDPIASGWGVKPLEPGPISYTEPVVKPTPVDTVAEGWAIFDKAKDNG